MTDHEKVVRGHIAALGRFDWKALDDTVAGAVQLRLAGVDGWEWSLSTLYRHISQGWDIMPEGVQLYDAGDGTVHAHIRFANGGMEKRILGDYQVTGDRIGAITLTDAPTRSFVRDDW